MSDDGFDIFRPAPEPVHYRHGWRLIGWLLLAALVWLSLTPRPPGDGLFGWDKLNHLFAYGGMMWWFAQAFAAPAYSALLLFSVGVVLEFAQGFGGRNPEMADAVANGLGVGLGWLAALGPTGRLLNRLDAQLWRLRARQSSLSIRRRPRS